MLILTRRIGETIIIGKDIEITVIAIKGNQVKIGIEAPEDVSIHREEIYEKVQDMSFAKDNKFAEIQNSKEYKNGEE